MPELAYIVTIFLCTIFIYQRLSLVLLDCGNLTRLLFSIAFTPILLSILSFFSMLIVIPILPSVYSSVGILILFFLLLIEISPVSYSGASKREFFIQSMLLAVACIIITPFFISMFRSLGVDHIDHDISLYFYESSLLAKGMLAGNNLLSLITQGEIHAPHGLTYQLYLAWGFLSSKTPGFGFDFIPKLLVVINQLALFFSVLFFVSTLNKINNFWFWVYVSVIPMAMVWEYQFNALSRDSYYLAPVFICLGLLQIIKENCKSIISIERRKRLSYGFLLSISVFYSFEGHSLGVLYASLILVYFGLVIFVKLKYDFFRIYELWMALFVALFLGFRAIYRYVFVGPGELGFVYPYLTDPVLFSKFENGTKFLQEPNFFEFISSIIYSESLYFKSFDLSKIFVWFPVVIFFVAFLLQLLSKVRYAKSYVTLFGLLLFLLISLFIFPMDMDGIKINSALMANFRYPMLLNLLSVLTVVASVRFVIDGLVLVQYRVKYVILIPFVCIVVWCWYLKAGLVSYYYSRPITWDESLVARAQSADCKRLSELGVQRIMLDSEGLLYRCEGQVDKLFSDEGAVILAERNDVGLSERLKEYRIDAFVFNKSIDFWWHDVHLYKFLDKNWIKINSETTSSIYISPNLSNTSEIK